MRIVGLIVDKRLLPNNKGQPFLLGRKGLVPY